jgi:hypothetical protein
MDGAKVIVKFLAISSRIKKCIFKQIKGGAEKPIRKDIENQFFDCKLEIGRQAQSFANVLIELNFSGPEWRYGKAVNVHPDTEEEKKIKSASLSFYTYS